MKKEFVMRGQTVSGGTEVLEFGGKTKENKNYAYRLTEFVLYGSTSIGTANAEMMGTITAGKTAVAPTDPNFTNEGLIGTSKFVDSNDIRYPFFNTSIVNDTFLITQNLILMVQDTGGSSYPVNWQCRFEAVKMTDSEAAVTNYKQFAIFDE